MNLRICITLTVSWICAALVACAYDEDPAFGGNANQPRQVASEDRGVSADSGPQGERNRDSAVEKDSAPRPAAAPNGAGGKEADPSAPNGAGGKQADPPAPDGAGGKQADPSAPDGAGGKEADPSFGVVPLADAATNRDAATAPVTGFASGCPALSDYQLSREMFLNDIPAEASGIAWNRDSDTFFIAANLQGRIWEYDRDLQMLLRSIPLVDMDMDTEGLAYLQDGWIAIAVESNFIQVVRIDENTTSISGSSSEVQVYQPSAPPPRYNAGFEGVAFRRPRHGLPGRIFTGQEYRPMRVLQFDHMLGLPPFVQRSYLNGTLVVEEPWDAEQTLSTYLNDISGMTYDETNDTLLIVSQESSKVIRVEPGTGAVKETLSLANTSTSEGIALFDQCRMAIVSEPNRLQIYLPNPP